jgi:hypothetical protein
MPTPRNLKQKEIITNRLGCTDWDKKATDIRIHNKQTSHVTSQCLPDSIRS